MVDPLAAVRAVAHRDPPSVAVDAQMNEVPTSDRQVAVDVSALRDVADLGVAAMRTPSENLDAARGHRHEAE